MSPSNLVSGAEVRLGGTPLDVSLAGQVLEIRVDTHTMLPDMFSMRIADPLFEHVDSAKFSIGVSVEVLFGASDQQKLTSIFDGQITSLEPEFAAGEVVLTIRGYDRSHLLNRGSRTETYQSMSAGEIARKVATLAGLTPGEIEGRGGVLPFVQQSNESDWAFLWRLAADADCEVVVDGSKLHFRDAARRASSQPVELAWGDSLLAFTPRVTGVQQVSEVVVRGWDPVAKQEIVGNAKNPALTSEIGISRSNVVSALGGGTVTVCDQPVGSHEAATALAGSIAGQLANAFVEADGIAIGNPMLRAGGKVKIAGVGTRFGGTYALSEAIHVFRSGRGYSTHLRITGRSPRTLGPLPPPSPQSTWRHSVVVGIVTNNNDPQKLGRIRVKYPTLDPTHEGWWARMTAPSAGENRGLLMLPRAGDEVLLAFEHDDDEHPYVIGAVWNGQGGPQTLAQTDGSFALRSDKSLTAAAVEQISIKGDSKVELQAGADMSLKASANLSGEAQGDATLQATGAMTLKSADSVTVQGASQVSVEGGSSVQLKAGGEAALEAGGAIQITGSNITIEAAGTLSLVGSQIMLG